MSTERDELAHLIERAGQFGPSTVECLRSQDAEYYAEAILAAGYRKIFDGDCGLSNAAPDERDAAEAWMRWANILTIGPDEERNGIAAMRQMLTEFGYRKPRTITIVEELDTLKFEAVVLDSYGTAYICLKAAPDRNEWSCPALTSQDMPSWSIMDNGPFTVLHEGDASV